MGGVIRECGEAVQSSALWLIDGPKHVFADVDATGDLLQLAQRVHELFEPFLQFYPIKRFIEGVSAITEFINARKFMSGLNDLISGKAAWEKPFAEGIPNFFKVAAKMIFMVGDLGLLAGWLSSIQVLGAWVKDSTAQIVSWGKEFNVLNGLGDVTCIAGSLLSICDTIRLMLHEVFSTGYMQRGTLKLSLLADHLLDLAGDIASLASSILANIPCVAGMWVVISSAVGSIVSLSHFFKNTYWTIPIIHDPQQISTLSPLDVRG